jgi:hypothetical protein
VDTILDNTLRENYFDTHALADFVSNVPPQVSTSFLGRCWENGCRDFLKPGLSLCPLSLSMDNIMPINQFAAPTGAQLAPPKSLKPILTPGYELRPCLISMV